jgi:hypothetical protein
MRKWVLPIILLCTLVIPIAVQAQSALTLSSLLIQIWPEYDKPGVLVMYDITLSGTTSLPAEVAIRIPKAVGEPNAVAVRQVDGSLYNMEYTRQVSGDWATISFTTTAPEVRVEYYDQGISKEGTARHFEYTWPGDYAIDDLTIRVQQPANATELRISPSFGTGATGSDNLVYYTQNVGAISAGQAIHITLDYQKPDDALSVENTAIQPSAPINESAAQSLNLTTWLPWIVAFVGAGLIIGGIFWFWQTGRQRSTPKIRRRHARATPSVGEATLPGEEASIYCSQCGKRAAPGDQFCRSCGAQLRFR